MDFIATCGKGNGGYGSQGTVTAFFFHPAKRLYVILVRSGKEQISDCL